MARISIKFSYVSIVKYLNTMIVGVSNKNVTITVDCNTRGFSELPDLASKFSKLAVVDHLLARHLRRMV